MFSYLTLSSMLLALLLWSVPSAPASMSNRPSSGAIDVGAVGAGGGTQRAASALAFAVSDAAENRQATSAPTIHISRPSPVTRTRDANDVQLAIVEAAREFGQDPSYLLRVAFCESRFNRLAVGKDQEIGLFQWQPRTWAQYAPALGYSIEDIASVIPQSRMTAWAFSEGKAGLWSCR